MPLDFAGGEGSSGGLQALAWTILSTRRRGFQRRQSFASIRDACSLQIIKDST
jgi:hypothetical protein